MKLEDIIALAKNGYSYKQVKELLEYVETSPAVQESPAITPDDVEHKQQPVPEAESLVVLPEAKKEEKKQLTAEDIINKLLS